MSELRVDNIVSQDGTAAPIYSKGLNIGAGVTLTNNGDFVVGGATSIAGNTQISGITTFSSGAIINGGVTINGTLTNNGSLSLSELSVTGSGQVGGALTVTGNLTVNGTQTTINTATLEVEDKNIGIASVSSPSNSTADGAGLTVYGGSDGDKTLKWLDSTDRWTFTGGAVEASEFHGDGSNLTGVISGVEVLQGGTSSGTGITALNFSGATIESDSATGISTITISGGGSAISTTASSPSANTVVTLDLDSAQHHELTLTAGITTITCSGGSFGDSHSIVFIQPSSGTATIGFSTYFLFPSGSVPVMSEGSGKIDLVSFVVKRVGAAGTQLLASAGLNYQ